MFKIILHTVSLPILFPLALLSQETVNQETLQDSVVIKNDSMTVATADSLDAFKERFTIYGKAAYGNGVLVPDAEVTLMDTLEKKLETTRTTTKLLEDFLGVGSSSKIFFLANILYLLTLERVLALKNVYI